MPQSRPRHTTPVPALFAGAPRQSHLSPHPLPARPLRHLAGALIADWYALRTLALRQVWHAHQS